MNWADLLAIQTQFHFIRPEYLWALLPLAVLWLMIGKLRNSTQWESYIPKEKLEALRVSSGRYSQTWRWLLVIGWFFGTIAAAGPTWKQVPVPTVRDESAMIIVLDLSRSMLAQDIAPDRLTRTKYKLIDILRMRRDGQTALVAYAGDPHTVSPLTDDPRTIESLLPALHPNIMPVQGSNTEAAFELAIQLLKDAGQTQGDILLLTDGVAPEAQRYIRNQINGSFRLSILGIGSIDAVPIPRAEGGFYSDSRGEIILTKLNRDELQIMAGLTSGRYVELQPDDSDIRYLLQDEFVAAEKSEEERDSLLYDSWEDMGFWLVLLILPFAAFSFRKGVIYVLPLTLSLTLISPNQSHAFGWDDLWLTADQQGQKLLEQQNPEDAAAKFEREDWAGVAAFEAEDFESATTHFSSSKNLADLYNKANSLAYAEDLEGALEAYDTVLEVQPGHEDALHNKAVIEQLLQQQEQQQSESDGESGEESEQELGEESEQQEGQEGNPQDGQDGKQSQEDSEQKNSQDQNAEPSEDPSSEQQQDSEQGQEQESEQQEGSEQESDEKPEQQQDSAQADEQSEEEAAQLQQELAQMMAAEATPDELEDASEQWLRAIPDDPSGLLRRKFDYESRQNQLEQRYKLQLPSNTDDERY